MPLCANIITTGNELTQLSNWHSGGYRLIYQKAAICKWDYLTRNSVSSSFHEFTLNRKDGSLALLGFKMVILSLIPRLLLLYLTVCSFEDIRLSYSEPQWLSQSMRDVAKRSFNFGWFHFNKYFLHHSEWNEQNQYHKNILWHEQNNDHVQQHFHGKQKIKFD